MSNFFNIYIMKKFNLSAYEANPKQKVVNRFEEPVEIIRTDLKGDRPILYIVEKYEKQTAFQVNENGRVYKDFTAGDDIFFADDE